MKKGTNEGEEIPMSLMLDEILARLPVKELCRFKCVSKLWLNSLSEPYFVDLHRRRQNQNQPFFFVMALPWDSSLLFPGLFDWELEPEFERTLHLSSADHHGRHINDFTRQIQVDQNQYLLLLPSHKGLVCLSTKFRIYICNPSTQELVELPKGSSLRICLFHVGFGYLPSSSMEEYKVVRLFYKHLQLNEDGVEDLDGSRLGCEVITITNASSSIDNNNNYSTSTWSWRVLDENCPYSVGDWQAVSVNGLVVWKINEWFVNSAEDDCILTFNLETEKFGLIPPPRRHLLKVPCEFYLVVMRGELWFVDYGSENEDMMDMWMLKEWTKFEWVKQYTIDFGDKPNRCRGARKALDIQGEVILFDVVGSLEYYNVLTQTFTPLGARSYLEFCYYNDTFFSLPNP